MVRLDYRSSCGLVEIYRWRREGRFGPAKEQLFEEALQDRKGQFTKAQIQELTKVVGRLERATREEIPRQARVAFMESQLHDVTSALSDGVRQHQQLSRELKKLTGMATTIPSELSEAIRSTIKPQGRGRLMRRRILVAIIASVLLLALFPTASEFVRSLAESVFAEYYGDDDYFTPRRTVSFLGAVVAGTLLVVTLAGRRGRTLAGKKPGLCISLAFLLFITALTTATSAQDYLYVSYGLHPEFNWLAVLSSCLFSAVVSLLVAPMHRFLVSFFTRAPLMPVESNAMVGGVEEEAMSTKESSPRE